MVLCDTCKHLGNMASWPCEDCLQGDRYERKPTTNADRIRAMSDEELAEAFERSCPNDSGNRCCAYFAKGSNGCFNCWLDWLRQEAESDG